ncbi:MAG: hypothetical protein L3K26_16230 [Candidatus Hydrogenedentes bacterium]|nr:hypothetical protein [Candidatus Hydrogenedentota bacterium]
MRLDGGLFEGTYTLVALMSDIDRSDPAHYGGYGVVTLGEEDLTVSLKPLE